MLMVRLSVSLSFLTVIPNSTCAERSDFVLTSLERPDLPRAYASYAPTCNSPCGWAALPFTR